MTDSALGDKWYYACDRCDYEGTSSLQRPAAEPGKQVRCPECHEPSLRREPCTVQE